MLWYWILHLSVDAASITIWHDNFHWNVDDVFVMCVFACLLLIVMEVSAIAVEEHQNQLSFTLRMSTLEA